MVDLVDVGVNCGRGQLTLVELGVSQHVRCILTCRTLRMLHMLRVLLHLLLLLLLLWWGRLMVLHRGQVCQRIHSRGGLS